MDSKEVLHLVIAIIIFGFAISFLQGLNAFLLSLVIAVIVIAVNLTGKQLTALYYSAKIENKIWQLQRWGWYERSHFKKPIPTGILVPFTITILSLGYVSCLTLLQIDIKPTTARVAKRKGLPRFTEMTEWQIGAIPLFGIIANLVLSLIIFIFIKNIPLATSITKFNIYYALWNLLPIGQLDGTKIFFGSRYLWLFLMTISIISTIVVAFLI